jgi:hypothetical protein
MTSDRLTLAALACFLVGLGLVLIVDLGVARIVGVPLAFLGIGLGVRAIASPEFLETDRSPEEGR